MPTYYRISTYLLPPAPPSYLLPASSKGRDNPGLLRSYTLNSRMNLVPAFLSIVTVP